MILLNVGRIRFWILDYSYFLIKKLCDPNVINLIIFRLLKWSEKFSYFIIQDHEIVMADVRTTFAAEADK